MRVSEEWILIFEIQEWIEGLNVEESERVLIIIGSRRMLARTCKFDQSWDLDSMIL